MMMDGNSNFLQTSSSSSCSSISSSSSTVALDLYGKRRQLLKIQILEREVGLLQEELKYVDQLQPASRCCKELDEFIAAKVDPLVTILKKKTHKSDLCWKYLCYPWNWCIGGCLKESKSCCKSSQRCMKKMGCSKCSSCGVSCCCCFSSSCHNCNNLCCNSSIPCCCL